MPPYRPVAIDKFGNGLNLRDKVDAVDPAEAIDALNVVFTLQGAVEQRAGYVEFTSSALVNRVDSLAPFYKSDGTRQLLAGAGTRLEALSTAGAVVASATGLTGGPYTFVRFGAPNAEVAYAGNGSDTLRKWDGATWTAPTGTVNGTAAQPLPRAGAIALMPTDNRLVAAGYTTTTGGPAGATSSPSHVYFSNPGLPETWEVDGAAGRGRNFVQLTPGDGERIMAVVPWRELVFVFKETKFFVFYGNDTQDDGTPVFNYRPVDTGQGLASARAIAVGRDGVYFMSRRGVYRTNGGEPQLISSIIDPIWLGGASSYFTSGVLNHDEISDVSMTWHDERLYLSYPSGASTTADRVLVYDTQLDWWSLFDFPAGAMTAFRVTSQADLMFAYAAGTNDIARHTTSATSDNGAAIESLWRSGWFDMGTIDVKTIREYKLAGTGEIVVSISRDYEAIGPPGQTTFTVPEVWGSGLSSDWVWGDGSFGDTLWGPSTQVRLKLSRKSARGAIFSVILENSVLNRFWSITSLVFHLREKSVPSVVTKD